jgi:acetyltransferase
MTKPTVADPAVAKPAAGKPVPATAETAHDILHQRTHPLDVFFQPKSVAVIGATETAGSVGRTILWNLVSNPFGGTVFPVNPKRASILGIKAYPNISAVPESVDLAIVVTPATTVPGIVGQCADEGVKGAVVISAGFKEIGEAGEELERQILAHARRGRMRVIGPNCLGVMGPLTGLNATFANCIARPGSVGFISQSGALCTAVLDWSMREMVGFSAFLSIGSMVDVGWGDLIDYLGDDPRTRSIVIYMESIGDARKFLSAAREVALTKPIIVIKAGRSEAAAKAAASHTGALAGSFEVLDAAFRRSGVLRVDRISDLFYVAEVLAKQPRPKGPHLTVLTNAGGPGVLATDALVATGGQLTELSEETFAALNQLLPPHWSRNNPIDILGDAGPDRYAKAVEVAAKDPNSNGLLVILTPQAMTDPTQTAEHLKPYAKLAGKPILASWMGGTSVAAGEAILNSSNIPAFPFPDTAARIFSSMWRYSYNLRGLYETPILADNSEEEAPDRALAEQIVYLARQSGRTILTEHESKRFLAAYHIPTVETRIATSEQEAVRAASEIGFPVVLKLHSETITHKTDVGGVKINLADESAARQAYRDIQSSVAEKAGAEHFLGVTVQPMIKVEGYELILGSSVDPQFGPVLLFGSGGQLVEVYRDRSLGLPPLNTTLARRMMEHTRIFTALQGVRGRSAVDLVALEKLLVRFSHLVVEQRAVKEIDINPLLASPERLLALDARVVLHPFDLPEEQLPKLAIRPYPHQYVVPWTMKDGTLVTLRPIRPEDEPLMVRFHGKLSDRTVYFRYFGALKLSQRVTHERLIRICFQDYDRELALVADYKEPDKAEHQIMGVGRLTKTHGANEAEFAVLVVDECQGKGLGTELLRRLLQVGREEKLSRVTGYILPENVEMARVCQKLGFKLHRSMDDSTLHAVYEL